MLSSKHISVGISIQKLFFTISVSAVLKTGTDTFEKLQVVPDIVERQEHAAKHLVCIQQMVHVSASMVTACVALAIR